MVSLPPLERTEALWAAGKKIRIEPKELNPSLGIDVIPDHWRCWLL